MISRASPLTTLIAAALVLAPVLAGCSALGGDSAGKNGAVTGSPAFVRLLSQADTALAGGALADAGRLLDEARAIEPDNPDLWVAIARLRFRGGEHLTALEAAERALEVGPDHAPALLIRALMVRDAHGFADALPWFEAALSADRAYADAWAEYAATLGDLGRHRDMLEAVRELADVAPKDARGFYLQAVLAQRGGEPVLARSLLERSGMAARGVPSALLLEALIQMDQGNTASAVERLETLASRQPANERVRELLARALLLGGREADLVARFAADTAKAEASPYLLTLVARAHERLGVHRSIRRSCWQTAPDCRRQLPACGRRGKRETGTRRAPQRRRCGRGSRLRPMLPCLPETPCSAAATRLARSRLMRWPRGCADRGR